MVISDILIHVDESIGPDHRVHLEESLRKRKGVVSPRFSAGGDHLMFVVYDADSTSASTILAQVCMQGYGAQIVGI